VARSPARLRPVDDADDLVTLDEHVVDLQVAVRENRCPGSQRRLGDQAVSVDHVGGNHAVRDEPPTFGVQVRSHLFLALAGPWRQ
jgi:hypothetical protein